MNLTFDTVNHKSVQAIKVSHVLLNVKLILLRFLLIKAIYNNKFYSDRPFEKLYRTALKLATRSRGLDLADFDELILLLEPGEDSVIQILQKEMENRIKALFSPRTSRETIMREVEAMLPSQDTTQIGAFPKISGDKVLVLTELVYHFELAYHHGWDSKFEAGSVKDTQIVANCLKAAKLGIPDLTRFDALNLLHVNLLRALVKNGEATLDQLISLRIKHQLE